MTDGSSSILEAPAEGTRAPETLFTQDQLEAHAAALATAHRISPSPRRSRPLLPRLDESAERLEEAYQFLSAADRKDAQPVGSEDWIRDNYYVIQDQIREIRQDLPRKFYIELAKLADGEFAGYPRVYLLARELIAHTAGRFDLDTLVDFATAYQRTAALSIGETWAIPIMLRLALVEELCRLVDGVVAARHSREQARRWEKKFSRLEPDDGRVIQEVFRAELDAHGRLSAAFVAELLQWLRDQPATAAPTWLALHRALEQQGDSPEELLRVEHQREATDQLAIGNVITSMRLLSSIDWPVFFDRVNVVEHTLRDDPAQAYAEMDFATRDRYRHSVEQLSKRSGHPEVEVALRARALSREAQQHDPSNDRRHHVGYYLISRGRFVLEEALRYRPSARERVSRFIFKHPAIGYLGVITLTTAAGVASLVAYANRNGATGVMLWIVGLVGLLPVSELAISLINAILTSQIRPRPLPKLAMRAGIPAVDRTIVVVPTIVDSPARFESLFDDLEVRFLANRDPHLHFALLSDFADAPHQVMPDDEALIETAQRRVQELNARYGPDRFYLFHRERRWNPREHCWMGHERKRGKLDEFNRLLRGATDTTFVVQLGDTSILRAIKYVITLDSDTRLPLEAGRRLVGTLSHPLNRPRFDPRQQRVVEGYGVLQPRVQVSVESAARTQFAHVYAGHVGVDPYTTAVSDVYQDLFHEGSYVGKGIYDVDAFVATLAGRVPEDTLLSHDLFEGTYARTGLCADIELVDDYPADYVSFAARQHRWVRGDWQIVRWLWRTVPDATGKPVPNTTPAIGRWKILDNLRRSLLPPALVTLFFTGYTILPGEAQVWLILGLLVLAFPAYTQVARSLSSRVRGISLREHVRAERDVLITTAMQSVLSVVFLLHQSWVMLDAIGRTLVRMLITRRHLLEWMTFERFSFHAGSLADVIRRMAFAPVAAVAMAVGVAVLAPARLAFALPVLALWFVSPVIAHLTGRPLRHHEPALDADARATLRRVARQTWRFFDDLVGPTGNWLVPDNIQEDRRDPIAHRTSPTNIGLQLLSVLAAFDLGYLNTTALLTRLERTFATLLKMQRYRGHFYNWYDTRTLAPLAPVYISTVDSGNLVGYLITLRVGLADIAERTPIVSTGFLEGLGDVIALAEAEIGTAVGDLRADGRVRRAVRNELAQLRKHLAATPETHAEWTRVLALIRDQLSAVNALFHEIDELQPRSAAAADALTEAGYWLDRAETVVAERDADLQLLAAWADHAGTDAIPSLAQLLAWADQAGGGLTGGSLAAIERTRRHATELLERLERLGVFADDLVEETEFDFLFSPERQLFSIGFSVAEGRLDGSFYDTLASEARLTSFIAIAMGKVSADHWFKLGRALTPAASFRALLSWSGSMFEYLMPPLVMRSYPGTLLDETYAAVIDRQIAYASSRGVPWGISESAYYAQDLDGNYQYRGFGVPGLGLKRGLAEDLVIAPYASLLAAPLAPQPVIDNLQRLRRQGMAGRFGFYEAIDYTPERIPKGHSGGVVLPTYMAHHQGMGLLALDNALHAWPMQGRFHADPRVQAAELLLQERIPRLVPLKNPPIEKAGRVPLGRRLSPLSIRRYVTPHTLSPRAHLLSNGSYCVMVTNAGGGYSRRQQLAMTRWREDITTDAWGTFIYVRDLETRQLWSAAFQPTRLEPDEYEVTFASDRATFRRLDADIEVRTEIVVSAEDDAELRRVSLTNRSNRTRSLDLTSYAEVVLAPPDADLSHPAFSNLFVQTTAIPERDALLCMRRPRAGTDRPYLFHVVSGRGRLGATTEYETDRARFVGRGRTLARPMAFDGAGPLSNTTGAVLDPIVSLRQKIRVPAGATVRLAFTTGFAETEEAARQLIEKYYDRRGVTRALALASTHAQVELRHLGLTIEDTSRFQRLSGRLLYSDPRLRDADAVRSNTRGQAELWKYGISGDLPILLVRLRDADGIPLLRELLKAHEYLRIKGLVFDLVVLNEHESSYLQDLQHAIAQLVEAGPEQAWIDRNGGVFLRRADLMPPEDQCLLRAAARVALDAADGSLADQLARTPIPFGKEPEPLIVSTTAGEARGAKSAAEARGAKAPADPQGSGRQRAAEAAATLELFNGTGGFANDGKEYVLTVDPGAGAFPPVPWSNVVAHQTFGFTASESSTGYTWSHNSHEHRLTPWQNDPVSDPPGEAMFIRDDESGRFWSATPLPAGSNGAYTVRHGQGSSTFERVHDELASTLRVCTPGSDAVKLYHLTLHNRSPRRRRCSVTLYVEWVLGENRTRTHLHVVTTRDPVTGALFARNAFRQEFANRVAFLDLSPGDVRSMTGDRTEFVGRNGSLDAPAALTRRALSDRIGAVLDPCGAIQVSLALEPGETRAVVGQLGDAATVEDARALVSRYRTPATAEAALAAVHETWDRLLGTLVVRTPDRAMDLMVNRWLPYQTLACRIWGRSAFYQSSGAFGFRDQLQDVLAFVFSAPSVTRAQLLYAASRQFVEGDVQHWWHEPGGQGVRTRFSDDRLWLLYATLQYVSATGDRGVFDDPAPFLEGRRLSAHEHEAYERPSVSREQASLYEHCVRAVALSLDVGAHGLPLIGTGDWNDGMNLVGAEGRGESVWLGWFLKSLLGPFADIAESRGDFDRASQYRSHAARLAEAIEASWDGAWYRRAYFDNGAPLGSKENEECRIDSIAQSWAVIAGGNPARARQAMASVLEYLVRRDEKLVLLLTPPFDKTTPSPGYIQGYVPGVRENGGQYTHAALWTVLAFAMLGDGDQAFELFSILNPINHTRTRDAVSVYRAEPYVVAADVYSAVPHTGRGGWTWYTGSAGWMYRVAVEAILGLTLQNGALRVNPCIPRQWPGYEARLRTPRAEFHLTIENPSGVSRGVKSIHVNGVESRDQSIALSGAEGQVQVRIVLG